MLSYYGALSKSAYIQCAYVIKIKQFRVATGKPVMETVRIGQDASNGDLPLTKTIWWHDHRLLWVTRTLWWYGQWLVLSEDLLPRRKLALVGKTIARELC